MEQEISVRFPNIGSHITKISKDADGYKIIIRGIDLLCSQNGLITKTYEEALFLLLYGEFPNKKELVDEQQNLYEGFFAGKEIFLELTKSSLNFDYSPLTQLQVLVLFLSTNKKLNPFFIVGAAFSFVAQIINKYLKQEFDVKLDNNAGLIENLIKTVGFSDIANKKQVKLFENMMIAWMDIGPSPSVISSILNSSLETNISTSIASGIGATSGLKHTSARMKILKTLISLKKAMHENNLDCENREILNNDLANQIVFNNFQNILDGKNLLYGFGHYFFKGPDIFIDPRITIVQDAIIAQNKSIDLLNILSIAKNVCNSGLLRKNGKSLILPINADGYWGVYLLTPPLK